MRANPNALHPLLLDPKYWRDRLAKLDEVRSGPLVSPRPDLSCPGRDVVEFRVRAHDGSSLWGILARPHEWTGPLPARVRTCGPCQRPEPDPAASEAGEAEFVFQEPAGRKLEDRVLDVLRVCRMAEATQGVDPERVHLACPNEDRTPDEFVIAMQLTRNRFR